VPWLNFWFSFSCFNRFTCKRVSNAVYCCTYIWQMALKWEKVNCSKVQYTALGVTVNLCFEQRGHNQG
jgi:hypothetical protein